MHTDDPKFEEWCIKQLDNDNVIISDDYESYIMESENDTENDTESKQSDEGDGFLEEEENNIPENLKMISCMRGRS